ncbi:hypothetical protein NLJ89_g7927 [Agrocybe chaxingu]|uniref:Uncharacterized protein n=1 Tax=Agrocybe chaxingu TaxID=84603 RepID=A0A9W8JTL7_9AGAR|nr:hypothetical protein NLJ89_g7927 [Agrocybe chaxingu]
MGFLTQPTPLSYFKVDVMYPTFRFQSRDHHFTSPNQSSLPAVIPEQTQLPANPPMSLLRQRLWQTHDRPYLTFMLKEPLAGLAMHQFSSCPNVTEGRSGWHLPWSTAKAWKHVDHCLRATVYTLSSYLKLRHPQIDRIWDEPLKPSSYGYFDAHPSESEARCRIADSIDGFVVYMAYLSFLICLGCFVGTSRSAVELFKAAQIVDQDLISMLLDSGIGSYGANRARVGVIVDTRQCPWINLVPFMVKADVPVWLYWGVPPFSVPSNSWISAFAPAFAPAKPNFSFASAIPLEDRASSQEARTDFPEVEKYSGQCRGETWEEFQRCCDDKNKATAETPEERDAHENRKRANVNHPQPGKRGVKVYHWEDVDGFLVQKLLTKHDVTVQWDNWSNSQRVYDSYSNVWDCCSDWGEDREDSDDEDGEYLCSKLVKLLIHLLKPPLSHLRRRRMLWGNMKRA